MGEVKFVLVALVDEEDMGILDNIPEDNIIEEMVLSKKDVAEIGHPILYIP